MMKQSQRNPSLISMQTIFMDGCCASLFLLEASSGWLTLTTGEKFLVFLKWILSIQKQLHDIHNVNPLAPERPMINKVAERRASEPPIPNLHDKKRYILHHKTLKQQLDLGLRIKKIHRGISFEEEPWLKSYIELNTNTRSNAKKEFEKYFFELMNNSVFGKTMENIRSHMDVISR